MRDYNEHCLYCAFNKYYCILQKMINCVSNYSRGGQLYCPGFSPMLGTEYFSIICSDVLTTSSESKSLSLWTPLPPPLFDTNIKHSRLEIRIIQNRGENWCELWPSLKSTYWSPGLKCIKCSWVIATQSDIFTFLKKTVSPLVDTSKGKFQFPTK